MLFHKGCLRLTRFVCKIPAPHQIVGLNTLLWGGGQAGGASVTKRQRTERMVHDEMLNKLCHLLGTFLRDSAPAGPKRKRKRKQKQVDSKPNPTVGQGLHTV